MLNAQLATFYKENRVDLVANFGREGKLPLTATLPKEFQNTFQPLNRNQLAKIRLSRSASFPLNQKVSVTRSFF